MLDLIHGSVDNMVSHLETVTKENPSVMVKQTFQAMALDVIAKVCIKQNNKTKCC